MPDSEDKLDTVFSVNASDGIAPCMKKHPRIMRTDKFLQHTRLDKFPQLINILKGDMIIVGPPPPLPREAAQFWFIPNKVSQSGKNVHKGDVYPNLPSIYHVR